MDIFGAVEWGLQIKVSYVEGAELGIFLGEDTVDHDFDQFERGCFGANVSCVADAVASDGDLCAIGVSFFWADFADDLGVGDFFASFVGNVVVVNDVEGFGALNAFGAIWIGADALTEAAEFIGVGFAPDLFVFGVLEELAVFEGLA